jgi:hypothetical protein
MKSQNNSFIFCKRGNFVNDEGENTKWTQVTRYLWDEDFFVVKNMFAFLNYGAKLQF